MNVKNDLREYAAATQRNRQSLVDVLGRVLPPSGTVLEIGSGTGEHSIFFAPLLLPRYWLPSEPVPRLRSSIAAWRTHSPSKNLLAPISLDAREDLWPVEYKLLPKELSREHLETYPITAIVNINTIHIAHWSVCEGLMKGAQRLLPSAGILFIYAPFKQGGKHTSGRNLIFDRNLRQANPIWGLRDLEAVIELAVKHNLQLREMVSMPKDHLGLVFGR